MKTVLVLLFIFGGLLGEIHAAPQTEISIRPNGAQPDFSTGPSDPQATAETRALFFQLGKISRKKILFGHQNANLEGVGWKLTGDSDVKRVSGYGPAVFGFDFLEIVDQHPGTLGFNMLLKKVQQAYRQGAVITFSWHASNPVTGGGSWDTTRAVAQALPGNGPAHAKLKDWLDQIADFFEAARDDNGRPIPVIFRPYHEMNGVWFWWSFSKPEEFKQLWRFTYDYLKNDRGLHNLLYCYSPDKFIFLKQYLKRYPGDEYVDILGFDVYTSKINRYKYRMRRLVRLANKKRKLFAITETGEENIPYPNYWTERLFGPLLKDKLLRQTAFVLLWRNDSPKHHFAPYPSHPSVPDFLKIVKNPDILFNGQHQSLYLAEDSSQDRAQWTPPPLHKMLSNN